MNTEAIFNNIAERIEEEINKSQRDIYLAVAWLTNKNLFNSLVKKSKEGVKVVLVISDNEINRNSSINYENIQNGESRLFWIGNEKSFMHNKFCIIDDYVVVTGSYNWSYKAESNFENIVITSGDRELSEQFKKEINRIIGEILTDNKVLPVSKIIKRLEIIKNYIILEELEDLDSEIRKIKPFEFDNSIQEIIQSVLDRNFGLTIRKIEDFLKNHQGLITWVDYELEALKVELKILENELAALEGEKIEIEKLLEEFNYQHTLELGDLITEILRIKTLLSSNDSEEYEKSQKEEKAYQNQRDFEEKKVKIKISQDEEKQLKKMYRKGVFKCHPDLFQNESKEIQDMVAEIYKSFDEAYDRQDIKEVERILNLLENGSISKIKKNTVNDKSKLEGIKEFLLTKISKVKKNLEELKENETYQDILEIKDWKEYFIELRIKLNSHLSELNKKLNTL